MVIVLLIPLLIASIPFGGAAPWAKGCVALGNTIAATLLLIRTPHVHIALQKAKWLWATLALLLWVALQPLIGAALCSTTVYLHLCLWLSYAMIAAAIAATASSHDQQLKLWRTVGLMGTIHALYALISFNMDLPWSSLPGYDTTRISGFFSGPNSLGGCLLITSPVSAGLLIHHLRTTIRHPRHGLLRWGTTLLLAFSLCLQLLALGLTASRTSIFLALLTLSTLCARYLTRRTPTPRTTRTLLIAILAACLPLGLFLASDTFRLAASRFATVSESPMEAFSSRARIWKGATALIRETPFGTGAGTFPLAYTAHQRPGSGWFRTRHAHCDYLEFTAECGFPGLAVLILLLLFLFRTLPQHLRPQRGHDSDWPAMGAATAVIGALLHAGLDFNLTSRPGVALPFFMLIGSLAARLPHPHYLERKSRKVLFRLAILVPVSMAPFLIRVITADRLANDASSASGGYADPYTWLPGLTVSEARAPAAADDACNTTPSWYLPHLMRGRTIRHQYQLTRDARAHALMAQTPQLSFPLAQTLADSILTEAEQASLHACVDAFDNAIAAMPHVDAYSLGALAHARLWQLTGSREEAARALENIATATTMAPVDLITLQRACRALSSLAADTELAPTVREQLVSLTTRALWLGAQRDMTMLAEYAWSAQLPPDTWLLADAPVDFTWTVIETFKAHTTDYQPDRFLLKSILAQAATQSRIPASASPATLLRSRRRVAAKALRSLSSMLLESGDLRDYAAMAEERNSILHSSVLDELKETTQHKIKSARQTFQLLERTLEARAPAPQTRILYLLYALNAGERLADRQLIDALLNLPTYAIAAVENDIRTLGRQHHKELASARLQPEAAPSLESFLKNGDARPSQKQRIALLQFQAQQDRSPTPLPIPANLNRYDPTLIALQQTPPTQPPSPFAGPTFRNGAIELTAIAATTNHSIQTTWVIHEQPPVDLTLVFNFRTDSESVNWHTTYTFAKEDPGRFAAGLLPLPHQWTIETKVPPLARLTEELRVSVIGKNQGQHFHTTEGLRAIPLRHWQTLDVATTGKDDT